MPSKPSQRGNYTTAVPSDRKKKQSSNTTRPEQWENELLEMRLKELKDARKLIATRSSVSGEDIMCQVKALNEKISCVAKSVIEMSIGWSRGQKGGQVFVGGFLRYPDRVDKSYLVDETFAQAILQVFLTLSCMCWVDSWYPGKSALDTHLRSLYGKIRKKEGQLVARKWRQLVCERELSPELDANILSVHARWITEQLMQTSSRLGEEDRKQVRKGVQDLMDISEKLRKNKAKMISDEFQPWIAWNEGVAYNSPSMEDVSGQFGGKQIQNPGLLLHVIGSTEVGLKAYGTADGDGEQWYWRPRVLLFESFNRTYCSRVQPAKQVIHDGSEPPYQSTSSASRTRSSKSSSRQPPYGPNPNQRQAKVQKLNPKEGSQRRWPEKQGMREGLGRREELKLEQVTKELALAQRFLSTVDTVSEADVVRALEALNEEIFQLTSMVADEIQLEEVEPLSPGQLETLRSRITALGPVFWDEVRDKRLENSLAIQIGWQGILVDWCSEIIDAWVVGSEGVNRDLEQTYENIKATNGQAVASCWRAIARSVSGEISSEVRGQLEDKVVDALGALPVVCGYISPGKLNKLDKTFRELIGPLLDICLKIRKMIGEEIMSTDIQPCFIKSGDPYDLKTAELDYEDGRGGSTKERGRFIACSLSLGLDHIHIGTERGSDGLYSKHRDLITKPKLFRTKKPVSGGAPGYDWH
ncbi:hypothetical protein AN958_05544 [Leucoagaricus sp. SymC.cos]|nr:hypothetical protein AN958_05544 [Leucoagaricus sp. SymC.cos]